MAQGRGFSAMIIFFCVLVLLSEMSHAATYVVGDKNGWNFNTVNWPNGKKFKAGDVLGSSYISSSFSSSFSDTRMAHFLLFVCAVFNYDASQHDVKVVDVNGYNSCDPSKATKSFRSGHDQITLASGTTYFICSIPGHCQSGMKIAVNAA